jgi:uncharacterized LabA/DUF88 family protein
MPSSRYAVFVDAGYLLAAGGWSTVGTWRRAEIVVTYQGLIEQLLHRAATALPTKELLRGYWYDAAPGRQASSEQLRVAELPDVKVRIGNLTSRGEQKGVDGLILGDLIELSGARAIDTAILVAGDGDLVEAVIQAQRQGVRVVLWGVSGTPQATVSPDLRREADRYEPLQPSELEPHFALRPPAREPVRFESDVTDELSGASPGVPAGGAPAPSASLSVDSPPVYVTVDTDEALAIGRDFGTRWRFRVSGPEIDRVRGDRPMVPGLVDAQLIRHALEALELARGTRLAPETLRDLRDGFWHVIIE